MRHVTPPRILALFALLGALLLPPWFGVECRADDDDSAPAIIDADDEGPTPEEIRALAESVGLVVMTTAEQVAQIEEARRQGAEPLAIVELVVGLVVGLLAALSPIIIGIIRRTQAAP